ncbi:SEC-C domain-containing protein [Oceanobacillus saliphilus]|uniref:SEC-C domain-containing protein n=1 Tax=Oceanobacillus saliphilus TaxID=2925834 RepID=UPI00201DEBF2|nr:SEC-C domain-containing protein [Oceanobacillus saliphilus]
MNKPGRNDPCPCGSRRKYKKCHGASNVIEISPTRYNSELELLHSGLIAFAFNEYEYELEEISQKFPQLSLLDDEERMESYMVGLTAWIILYEPIHDNQTIFDIYYKKQQKKIKHEKVRRTFAAWSGAVPSIYVILSKTEEKATLQDVRTKDMYNISVREESDFEVGSMAIGILIPFVQEHEFLLTMLEVFDVNEGIIDMAEALNDEEFVEDFPDILAKALTMEINTIELEWENPLYEMVANLFARHMREKATDEGIIKAGMLIWKIFTEKANPSFKKLGTYAAALEYVVQSSLSEGTFQSQSELAKEYDTTSGTVSKNVRKIIETLDEELEEIIDELIGDEVFPEEVGDLYDKIDGDYSDVDEGIIGNNHVTMEKTMRDIQKAVEKQDFDSEEEMRQFLNELLTNQEISSPVSTLPRDIAQDKLYEAQQAKGAKRKKLVKEALEIYPNSPDAYALMAKDAKTVNEQYQLYHQAVIAGEEDLGKEFFRENKGHFWLMTETRPYMRAKADFATIQYNLGEKSSAITHYEELLELNPNDNQGIRYQLLPVYLEEEKYEEAKELLYQYDGDNTANFLFNNVLLHYLIDGLTSKTKSLLKKAMKQNPYVKAYLTGKKPVPKRTYNSIGIGDEKEAIVYVQEHLHIWKEALPLLSVLEKS